MCQRRKNIVEEWQKVRKLQFLSILHHKFSTDSPHIIEPVMTCSCSLFQIPVRQFFSPFSPLLIFYLFIYRFCACNRRQQTPYRLSKLNRFQKHTPNRDCNSYVFEGRRFIIQAVYYKCSIAI